MSLDPWACASRHFTDSITLQAISLRLDFLILAVGGADNSAHLGSPHEPLSA